jgi:hypothetical protein
MKKRGTLQVGAGEPGVNEICLNEVHRARGRRCWPPAALRLGWPDSHPGDKPPSAPFPPSHQWRPAPLPGTGSVGSGTVLTCAHSPCVPCLQRLKVLSAHDTARRAPVTLHETRHTGAEKVGRHCGCHVASSPGVACVQMATVPSSAQDASMFPPIPLAGDQATSRTHSLWGLPRSSTADSHLSPPVEGSYADLCRRTLPSDPATATRLTKVEMPPAEDVPPTWAAGAHETALQPVGQSADELTCHVSSSACRGGVMLEGEWGERGAGAGVGEHVRVGSVLV